VGRLNSVRAFVEQPKGANPASMASGYVGESPVAVPMKQSFGFNLPVRPAMYWLTAMSAGAWSPTAKMVFMFDK